MNSTADFIEYLGVDAYHQGRLAVLFHMLASNPRIPFAPNTTQAWNIVRKVGDEAGVGDTAVVAVSPARGYDWGRLRLTRPCLRPGKCTHTRG